MRRIPALSLLVLAAACGGGRGGASGPAPVPANITARAEIRDAEGRSLGTMTLSQTPHGVLVSGELTGAAPGVHAIHFHDVGRCEAPFTSAGGHFNPTQRVHGFRIPAGYHAGDLPNFTAPASGNVRVDLFSDRVTLGTGPTSLLDTDGSSIVIHATADDYATDPAGNSGGRIACGVIRR
ncbi:superoxide dismutase family protein [Roseisolibacter sp. H3M3-2]|uniref:superoxide dismutase family protein n=1 Tax=Roseisolibacter sp. H3M3-2 TaxID=3031323 RepID=UPI0023DBC557|nr:superoxide dismutase family protein [Roseisolibacter sp. H3M3-2]MDF1502081.1 superoxide dismutase family protein [Roseisolibacter sp. H3M3-2]